MLLSIFTLMIQLSIAHLLQWYKHLNFSSMRLMFSSLTKQRGTLILENIPGGPKCMGPHRHVQKHSRPNSSKHSKVGKNCSPCLGLSLSDWTQHKNSKLHNWSCYVYNYMGLSQQHTTAALMLLGFDTVPDKLLSVWLDY